MLSIGLIGSMTSIMSHARNLKNIKGIRIIGKSSVGWSDDQEARYLNIPEFNRRELVEAADLLLVDRSSLLLPDLLNLAVRNSRHLYFSDFPEISSEECADLLKLADESGSIIKIKNPLLTGPSGEWITSNWQEPAAIFLQENLAEIPDQRELLLRYVYFAVALFKIEPQKIRVSAIPYQTKDGYFINFRFDYTNSSLFNVDLLFAAPPSQSVRAVLPAYYMETNSASGVIRVNHKEITPGSSSGKDVAEFISSFEETDQYRPSDLPGFCTSLSMLNELLRKTELFTSWK